MPRSIAFEVPGDTSLFTPLQLQSRAVLRLAMEGWARWLRAHLVSFSKLVHHHRFGVVVTGIHLEYLAPLRFEDDRDLQLEVRVRAVKGGALLEVTLDLFDTGKAAVAKATVIVRPLKLAGDASMSATPGPVPPELLQRFEADEVVAEGPKRVLPALVAAAEAKPALGTQKVPLRMWRHLCEVADQWSFIETAGFFEAGRDALALSHGAAAPVLRKGLSSPLTHLDIELSRPSFLFDALEVETTGYEPAPGTPLFVHRLKGAGGEVLATAVERFGG